MPNPMLELLIGAAQVEGRWRCPGQVADAGAAQVVDADVGAAQVVVADFIPRFQNPRLGQAHAEGRSRSGRLQPLQPVLVPMLSKPETFAGAPKPAL